MMFVLALLATVSLSSSLASGEISLIIVSTALLLLLLYIVWHDVLSIRFQLGAVFKKSKGRKASLPLLSNFNDISETVEVLNARINNLENEVAVLEGKKMPEKGKTANDWLSGELLQLSGRFQGAAVSIVLPQGETIRYEASQPLGRRFEGQLLGLVEWWMQRGDRFSLGAYDALADKGFWGDFSPYGYLGYILEPLVWKDSLGQTVRGALWLGFKAGKEITRSIREAVTVECAALESLIVQYMKIALLEERAKLAEEKSEDKSEFITHMSHDIRSPLNNVKAIFHLLQNEGRQSDEIKEFLHAGLLSCENVSEMLETLLDYSKLKAGKMEARCEIVSPFDLLSQGVGQFQLAAKAKGLELLVHAGTEGQALMAYLDTRQFKRILFNLISNAIKYTEHGVIEVSIASLGSEIGIEVRDSGRGISKAQLSKLFLPFERLNNDMVEGAGIGLMLAKALVELNKGSISVTSTPGEGSLFSIRFPRIVNAVLAQEKKTIEPCLGNSLVAEPEMSSVATVLLVDDDGSSNASLKKLLERSGFEVLLAGGFAEALSILTFQKPDIIISDVCMPDGGGNSLVLQVRERFPGLPILLLTGERDTQKLARLKDAGALEILEKPLDFSRLKAVIVKALEKTVPQKKPIAGISR